MSGQRAHEGVVNVVVDKLQQGPDRALGRPGIGVGAGPAGTITTGTMRSAPSPPTAVMVAAINVPGKGKSILAETPSLSPVRAPNRWDRRWVNQRSTPRVGTATTSRPMGSGSGSRSMSPKALTRWSARDDLCKYSTCLRLRASGDDYRAASASRRPRRLRRLRPPSHTSFWRIEVRLRQQAQQVAVRILRPGHIGHVVIVAVVIDHLPLDQLVPRGPG